MRILEDLEAAAFYLVAASEISIQLPAPRVYSVESKGSNKLQNLSSSYPSIRDSVYI